MDWSVVKNALPTIPKGICANLSHLQWFLSSFAIAVTLFLITVGRIQDIINRRKLFVVGLSTAWLAPIEVSSSPSLVFLLEFQ